MTPRPLNHDAMGRALDKVAEACAKEVYALMPLQAVCPENIILEVLHADSWLTTKGTENGVDVRVFMVFSGNFDAVLIVIVSK